MTSNIAVIFPLFYSVSSLKRLECYVKFAKNKFNLSVFVYCSNPRIESEARAFCAVKGFQFIPRDNFGGGEGIFVILEEAHFKILSQVDYWIYLEESCEPLIKTWINLLIYDLHRGALITGWHWNWRAKKRPDSKKILFGSGSRTAIAYENDSNFAPFKSFTSNPVLDAPGFRHECVASRSVSFQELDLCYPDYKRIWPLTSKEFGLAMERFYWPEGSAFDRCPNFQYQLLVLQAKLPHFLSKNYLFFRELNSEEKNLCLLDGINYRWKKKRKIFFNVFHYIVFVITNLIKFFFVVCLRIDLVSREWKRL